MVATDRLFGWCRMPDIGDPEIFLAGCAAILAEYPQAVRDAICDPRSGSRALKDYPSLRNIREACDRLYEPIGRELERKRSLQSFLPEPPRKPRTREEQARVDAQVATARALFGIPEGGIKKS